MEDARKTRKQGERPWSSGKFALVASAILIASILIGYGGSLRNGLVADDFVLVQQRLPDYLHDFSVAKAFRQSFFKEYALNAAHQVEDTKDYYRPIVTISYAIDAKVWRERTAGYHLTNLLLHAIATGLVLLLLRQLGVRRALVLPAAVLFAVHPIHVSNVAWIAGRTDLLAAVFLLAAMVAMVRHLQGAARLTLAAAARLRSSYLWLALLAYLLAILSKEMSLTYGGLVFLYAALARRTATGQPGPRWPWLELVLIGIFSIGYFIVRATILGLPDFKAGASTDILPFRYGVFPTVYSYYWRHLFLPGTFQFYVPFPVPVSAGDPRFIVHLVLLMIQIAAVVFLLRRLPLAGFGAAWVLVSILPVSQLVPLAFRAIVAEYWAYIPSVGFVVLIAAVGEWLFARHGSRRVGAGLPVRHVVPAALLLVALVWVVQIPARSALFRTWERLLVYETRLNPDNVEAWISLAALHGERGQNEAALRCLREAVRRGPGMPGAHSNLANIYQLRGDLDSAMVAYRTELEIQPKSSRVMVDLADVLIEKGAEEEVPELYRRAIALDRKYAEQIPGRAQTLIDASIDLRQRIAWPERERGLSLAAGILRCYLDAAGDDGTSISSTPAAARTGQYRASLIASEIFLGRYDRARAACGTSASLGLGEPQSRALCAIAGLPDGGDRAIAEAHASWNAWAPATDVCQQVCTFYQATGRGELAIPLWRALLRGGRLKAEDLNHTAATALRDTSRPGAAAEARAIWELLLEEIPDYPFSLLNLGGLAYSAGDKARCRGYWQRFLARHPDRPEAADVRAKLAEL